MDDAGQLIQHRGNLNDSNHHFIEVKNVEAGQTLTLFATTHQIIARGDGTAPEFSYQVVKTMELSEEQATMLNTAHGTDFVAGDSFSLKDAQDIASDNIGEGNWTDQNGFGTEYLFQSTEVYGVDDLEAEIGISFNKNAYSVASETDGHLPATHSVIGTYEIAQQYFAELSELEDLRI